MAMIGSQDLVVGLVIVLVLFGAKRLPELAASLGKSMKEFKKGVAEVGEEEPGKPPAPSTALTAMASRSCPACTTPLDPVWSHCPRCGAAAGEAPKSQESR
jgi:sec-independent protein translocase protein TatA